MSRLHFQSRIELTEALNDGTLTWQFTFRLSDNEGIFGARHVDVGDVLVLDTGAAETGTLTRYRIATIVNTTWDGQVEALAVYEDDNNNRTVNPDLTYTVGLPGIITRPTTTHGFLPLPSSDVQQIPDRFGFYLQNYNNQVLDTLLPEGTGGGSAIQVITAEGLVPNLDGHVLLPQKPLGDLIWNMALIYLSDGSAMEATGVSWIEDTNDTVRLVIPQEDLDFLHAPIDSVTVSFLGTVG